jgi:hypothetical protein
MLRDLDRPGDLAAAAALATEVATRYRDLGLQGRAERGAEPAQRTRRRKARRSPTSRSGTSMAGKWPPRSNSVQRRMQTVGSQQEEVDGPSWTVLPV